MYAYDLFIFENIQFLFIISVDLFITILTDLTCILHEGLCLFCPIPREKS